MRLEKIKQLVNSIGQSKSEFKKDDLEMLDNCLKTFSYYVRTVNDLERAYTVGRFHMEEEYYKYYVESLDKGRRFAHDAAVNGMTWMDNVCREYSTEKIFTVEELGQDRHQKGRIIMEIVKEIFDSRRL